MPALPLQERRDGLREPFLHIDDGAVLVEREYFDFAPQDVGRFHRVSLQLREALTICGTQRRSALITVADKCLLYSESDRLTAWTRNDANGMDRPCSCP